MPSKLAAAVDLAKQGYRVFPLAMNGKTPVHDGNWRKTATTDPARVAEMWTCPVMGAELDYNIGIALDANTMVFDEDVSEGKKGAESVRILEACDCVLPVTRTVRSARGGRHRYLTTPTPVGNSSSKVGKHIDIKSEGGFVVGPGSEVDGVPYVVEVDAPLAPAPEWLIGAAGAPRRRAKPDTAPLVDEDTESAIARAIDYLSKRAPESGTYAVAAWCFRYGLSVDTLTDLMVEHWPPGETKGYDHIRTRVENAYRYRTSAHGDASPEAEFDAVEIDQSKEPPKRKGLFWQTWSQTQIEADRPYLIDGILDAGTMIVTYGDSNTGKSFVAIDQGYHIAAGKEWNGHKVRRGPVVYVASEGGPGLAKRIEALRRTHGAADVPFYTVPCLVDLYADNGSTGPLVKLIREIEAHAGEKVVLIVIDTLARAMGGGDENTSTDMGKFVGNCDRIRAATGAALNIVHHTGKDKARGARGSSALRAATDTEIEIDAGTLTMTKQRDGGKPDELKFTLDVVEVGRREDGAAVTSCVVRWLSVNDFSDEVSPQAEQMLEILERLVAAKKDEIEEDETIPENDKANKIANASVPWKLWELSILSVLKGARGKPIGRTHLFPLRQELSNSGKIAKDKYKQWFIK